MEQMGPKYLLYGHSRRRLEREEGDREKVNSATEWRTNESGECGRGRSSLQERRGGRIERGTQEEAPERTEGRRQKLNNP